MKYDDFRCIRQGVHLAILKENDAKLLAPIDQRSAKKERALLLLHGFSSSPATFRHILPQLKHYDALIAPVLPGHAADLVTFSQTNAQEWLQSVELLAQQLMNDYTKLDVFGLSLGGLLACHLSNLFPLNHLYLLAPALALNQPIDKYLKLAKALRTLGFYSIRSASGNIFSTHHCEMAYNQLPLNAIIEIFNLIKHFKFLPPSCPTDVFLGKHDLVVDSEAVAQRFASCPHAQVHWLEKSAHVLTLDGDIDYILQCVQKTAEQIAS